jgi:phosphoribosyl-dephospho-CoA transferase
MAPDPRPARHDLVWLAPGWRRALAAPLEPAIVAALDGWIERGRPAVACRTERAAPGVLALGVALPPDAPVRRAALLVHARAVARTSPPLALAEALPSAPARWRDALAGLDRSARAAGLTLHVYGSLAWEHLSGAPYLTAASDVDLLARVEDAAGLRRAVRLLASRADDAAPRLDGEILLPGDRGVAWRELAARPQRVLVKSADGVALVRTRDALGPLAEGLA